MTFYPLLLHILKEFVIRVKVTLSAIVESMGSSQLNNMDVLNSCMFIINIHKLIVNLKLSAEFGSAATGIVKFS